MLSGTSDPGISTGVDGDFYINTTSNTFFGPKASNAWPTGVSLVGPIGAMGASGKTILNGRGDPNDATTGNDGDFYIDLDTYNIFGPKFEGEWGGPTLLKGADGLSGNTVLSGTSDPSMSTGVDGDFYINTADNKIFGPKASGTWPTGVSLLGISSIGTISSTSTANGASITAGELILAPADGTNGGIVTTTAQTFAGAKTFSSDLTATGFKTASGTSSEFLKADGTVDANTYVPKNTSKISIGTYAADSDQDADAVSIGNNAGRYTQGVSAVAMGAYAGNNSQSNNAVAMGSYAGSNTQGASAVAMGVYAGVNIQGYNAVAIGSDAGSNTQGNSAVAMGVYAGNHIQGESSIAIGNSAGNAIQGNNAVAMGSNAGSYSQGQNAIAIGNGAGVFNQSFNSIILNASGMNLDAVDQGFYVKPIRDGGFNSSPFQLYYDPSSGEITYSLATSTLFSPVASASSIFNNLSSNSILTGSLTMTSDRRLKSDVKTLPSTLDIIKNMNPVSYKKKDSIASTQYNHEEMGFIAQEIQKVLPMLVVEGTDKDKTLSVNYISLIPVLTKAIQEQQTQIEEKGKQTDELKKQLDRQQKEINELRELIKSIKK